MKKIITRLLSASLLMLCAMPLTVAKADVTLWIRTGSAPFVYAFNYNGGINILDYAAWPGKQLDVSTVTSDGETWWLCHLEGTLSTDIVLNSGYGSQTADITGLVDGTYYYYYNEVDFYLDLTQAKNAEAYAFLQPNGNVDWSTSNADFAVDGQILSKCGGYNGGKDVYLWTSNTEPTNGEIKFDRLNPNNHNTIWNSFHHSYQKGGFYEPSDWNDGYVSTTAYQDIVFPIGVAHNSVNFPDAIFRNWLATYFGTEIADGYWTPDEIQYVTCIQYPGPADDPTQKLSTLQGIEHFTSLRILECQNNQISSLDLTHNPVIEYVDCSYNNLTLLDVTGCSALYNLDCAANSLTSLDVSDCAQLKTLYCQDNAITTDLDLTYNAVIEEVDCSNNHIKLLDATGCASLEALICFDNDLTSLYVTGCTSLQDLLCSQNDLYSLDVSDCAMLTLLDCTENAITALDVTNNTALERLFCHNNCLTSLDLSQNTSLTAVNCYRNNLTSLDLSNNPISSFSSVGEQTTDFGKVIEYQKNGTTYYFIWLNDQFNGGDPWFVSIVNALEGATSPTYTPFDLSRVVWYMNCELFSGTAQNGQNSPRPLNLSNGLDPNDIAGDILLLDGNESDFTYLYETNGAGQMDVTASWSGSDPSTGIKSVMKNAVPVSVRYINEAGVGSDTPWPGMNIIVKTMDNGSHAISKEMR